MWPQEINVPLNVPQTIVSGDDAVEGESERQGISLKVTPLVGRHMLHYSVERLPLMQVHALTHIILCAYCNLVSVSKIPTRAVLCVLSVLHGIISARLHVIAAAEAAITRGRVRASAKPWFLLSLSKPASSKLQVASWLCRASPKHCRSI